MWSIFYSAAPSEFTKSKMVVMPSRIFLDWRCLYFEHVVLSVLILAFTTALYSSARHFPNTNSCSIRPFFLAFLIHAKWQLFAQGLSRLYCFAGRVGLHSRRNWHEIDVKLTDSWRAEKRACQGKFHKLKLKLARTKHKEISLMGFLIYNELYHH